MESEVYSGDSTSWGMLALYVLLSLMASQIVFTVVLVALPAVIVLPGIWLWCRPYKSPQHMKNYTDTMCNAGTAFSQLISHTWNGYEIANPENIPDEGPALLIVYHGSSAITSMYFIGEMFALKGARRLVHSVTHRSIFKIPGMTSTIAKMGGSSGDYEVCKKVLEDQKLLMILPGGAREEMYGGPYYDVVWNNRCGFARLALDTGTPIIPMFHQNDNQHSPKLFLGKTIHALMRKYGVPLLPLGLFPVKIRTFIGKPVEYDPSNTTPQELAALTQRSLEDLIREHQRLPGSIFWGIMDRFKTYKKTD